MSVERNWLAFESMLTGSLELPIRTLLDCPRGRSSQGIMKWAWDPRVEGTGCARHFTVYLLVLVGP